MRHLRTLCDLQPGEIERIFAISHDLKTKLAQGHRQPLLPSRVMAMLFEKPSLRTRVSFETAMIHLGGGAIFLGSEAGFGTRESMPDFARVLSSYVDVIVARVFDHQKIEGLAEYATCSVINGLSDFVHPCQALSDLFTMKEQVGRLNGLTVTYLGDGNNVARSLALGCGKLGLKFRMAHPEGHGFEASFLDLLKSEAPGLDLGLTNDPREAVEGANFLYTDVWASMGQESEAEQRRKAFAPFQVNQALMDLADPEAYFMHCLPAHRGEEVSAEVMDGPRSIVIEQAANRMHVQKGLLAWLLASQADK